MSVHSGGGGFDGGVGCRRLRGWRLASAGSAVGVGGVGGDGRGGFLRRREALTASAATKAESAAAASCGNDGGSGRWRLWGRPRRRVRKSAVAEVSEAPGSAVSGVVVVVTARAAVGRWQPTAVRAAAPDKVRRLWRRRRRCSPSATTAAVVGAATKRTGAENTPSQDPVYRLFWVATAVTNSHRVLASNAIVYWSDQNLSASSRITPKTAICSCDSPRGSSQPPQLAHERGGGSPCRDLYLRKIGTDPPPSPRCDARHVLARLAHSTTRHAAAHSPLCPPSAVPSAMPMTKTKRCHCISEPGSADDSRT